MRVQRKVCKRAADEDRKLVGYFKQLAEEERYAKFGRRSVEHDFDFLYLFTNSEASPVTGEFNWFFQIWADIGGWEVPVVAKFGMQDFCRCDECRELGAALLELYSVVQGLGWISRYFPELDIWLWISSKGLFEERDSGIAGTTANRRCVFLESLMTSAEDALRNGRVEILRYGTENKEVLPSVSFRQASFSIEDNGAGGVRDEA